MQESLTKDSFNAFDFSQICRITQQRIKTKWWQNVWSRPKTKRSVFVQTRNDNEGESSPQKHSCFIDHILTRLEALI